MKRDIWPGFIVFEGLDGAGKGFFIDKLKTWLDLADVPSWFTREPSELPTGQLIRQVLRKEIPLQPDSMARLFSADRHEHLYGGHGIQDHLKLGRLVICDRYMYSSLAYQAESCQGEFMPFMLNSTFPTPDLLIYLDISPEQAMERIEARGTPLEVYETLDFQRAVYHNYDEAIANAASMTHVLRLKVTLPAETVAQKIFEAVQAVIGRFPAFIA